MSIRDRVKGFKRVCASELRHHERNWRTHPESQISALNGILSEVGFAGAVIARELHDGTLQLIDGHARANVAGDSEIPVLILDVDEKEADKILATFDPIGAMAGSDAVRLDELLRNVDTGSEALQEMLADVAEAADLYDVSEAEPPELAAGDRAPFRQMTFTVHDEQHETIEAAIAKAKKDGGGTSEVNENTNGNALSFICKAYLDG